MRRLLLVVAIVVAVLTPGVAASAHTQLLEATPAKDATLASAPTAVTLKFSQRLNPDFTTIVVSDASRQRVPAGAPAVDGDSGTLTLGAALGNGAYTVAYRVVSSDGHTVQGSYVFTVADPARPAAATPAEAAAAAAPAPDDSPPGALIGLGAALLVLVVGAGAYLYTSRRNAVREKRF
ncbi:copper resistance CopC family protein [Actinoplanes sp. HUAS TT8]|uniref:copper resistance CopC family protein n=1 Tax=Actinoplanes sp. HUAS TT8 TaxID=3447453 RepID=UPI003F528ECB